MMDQYGGMVDENQPKPGQPMFIYVAKVSDEDRAKVLSAAFAKARSEAEQLAAAANAKIGSLTGLQSHAIANESRNYGYNYAQYQMQQYMFAELSPNGESAGGGPVEAIGTQPGEVSLGYNVIASFELIPSQK
jgi:hypothetical protein